MRRFAGLLVLLVVVAMLAASENSEAPGAETPGAQGSNDSQLRDEIEEIEHEWYVMCPPLTTNPADVAASAPFTQWRLGTHWPNRETCERQRAAVARLVTRRIANSENERVHIAAMQHCRCFSSNDPRLDQKFVRKLKHFYLEELYREGTD